MNQFVLFLLYPLKNSIPSLLSLSSIVTRSRSSTLPKTKSLKQSKNLKRLKLLVMATASKERETDHFLLSSPSLLRKLREKTEVSRSKPLLFKKSRLLNRKYGIKFMLTLLKKTFQGHFI